MTVLAFTGHRPKDLPPNVTFGRFAQAMDELLDKYVLDSLPDFVTGGALGVDTWAAQYAIDLHANLNLILPFSIPVMTKFWQDKDRERLYEHARYATSTTGLMVIDQTGRYNPAAYQRRNIAMIDRCDTLIAVWSGKTHGGTWNAIQYARSINKPIAYIWSAS